ncbi:putative cytochrome P450 [Deinococcus aerius]|uniref:Putative cytochrome P450 n=1 Tax=Deinococcus aerius TaxID=200253 RepID=A0A2I9E057_9DEIO|nr:cytochrome P450 [Deinococcus aerius]GBF06785.1 putative cytochrome P450 [Deinococcus aerius]
MTASSFTLLDPFPWYADMRRASPVVRDPQSGMWMVFDYAGVQRTLSDWKAFSSERGRPRGENAESALSSSIISTDPPRHRQLRALVEQAFTPRQVRALAPRIGELVDELLAPVEGSGRMDFVLDLAYPLPVIVIAEILGIPASDRDRFKRWSDAVVTGDLSGSREMAAYFGRLIEERRHVPGEDLISGLIAAQVGGEHLNTQELLGFCILLLVAGNETTTNLLANTVLCWQGAPEAYERVVADRDLLPTTIEESLRFRSPVQSMFRVTAQDVELGGQLIPEGSPVLAWIGSANRDEAQFPDAARFDPARTPNRHLAFGHGVHFCLGAPLARLEASLALEALLERLPNLRVAPGTVLDPIPSQIVSGVKRLPVTFG